MRSALEEAQTLAHSTAQGTRAQTTSHKLRVTIFWNFVCLLLCVINNFPISRNAFQIVVGGRDEKCKRSVLNTSREGLLLCLEHFSRGTTPLS